MENVRDLGFLFYLLFLLVPLTGIQVVQSSSSQNHVSKLFVFGDSYVDTGNHQKSVSPSWKLPYGITFPGRPTGRFSDGRLLTDFIASFVGIKSPIPYQFRKKELKRLRYGMNFAYGGTGVFDTLISAPNLTTQIDFFQQLIQERVYTNSDLVSSLALISVAGNDYGSYNARNGSAQGLPAFTASLVNQLALSLKRIHGMGVKKVAVTALEPLGCIPQSTASSSYQQCNGTQNMAVNFHNLLLQRAVEKLNNESKDSTFIILDIYSAFMSIFKGQGDNPGKFDNLFKPCCMGLSDRYSCGSVDESGIKKYTVCKNPQSSLFWDSVHPSQGGWLAVSSALKASLGQLYT